ncbi:hypothetical protein [Streptomyces sp. NPDC007991]|uniref:hypothetical protein n=1 Tax=Streptomyces sp. NPDC007991 TaxID=3364803 RepID=UPI0036EA2183
MRNRPGVSDTPARRYGRLAALGAARVLIGVGATAVAAPIETGQSAPSWARSPAAA